MFNMLRLRLIYFDLPILEMPVPLKKKLLSILHPIKVLLQIEILAKIYFKIFVIIY